jgi:hypothetical protein
MRKFLESKISKGRDLFPNSSANSIDQSVNPIAIEKNTGEISVINQQQRVEEMAKPSERQKWRVK